MTGRSRPAPRGAGPMTSDGQPRLLPLLLTLAAFALAVAYALPLTSTADPLWFLPPRLEAERVDVFWQGARTSIARGDPRYRGLMEALDDAFASPTGIELNYGLRPSDVEALRSRGRALEAVFATETRAHGRYPLGPFTRVLVPFDGEEYARRLVFVGDASGYRAGPIRAPSVERLRDLADSSR